MFVLLPKKSGATSGGKGETQIITRQIIERLVNTGYTHVALVHTVYGRPHDERDRADVTLPSSLWSTEEVNTEGNQGAGNKEGKKLASPKIQVLRRLHAVIENVSDVGYFSATNIGPSEALLREYDIVSLCPRNDATFQAACSTPTVAQIITLDYTGGRGGVQLPYKIRSPDVLAAVEKSVVWELPYAPAILDVDKRKALIKTCRELQMAHLNIPKRNFRILFSSGDRIQNNRLDGDVGDMALRTPDDLINVLQTVCRFDSKTSHEALSESGTFVLNQVQIKIQSKKVSKAKVARVYYEGENDADSPEPSHRVATHATAEHAVDKNDDESDDPVEDGFIKLS